MKMIFRVWCISRRGDRKIWPRLACAHVCVLLAVEVDQLEPFGGIWCVSGNEIRLVCSYTRRICDEPNSTTMGFETPGYFYLADEVYNLVVT